MPSASPLSQLEHGAALPLAVATYRASAASALRQISSPERAAVSGGFVRTLRRLDECACVAAQSARGVGSER